jgi:hypothetical protein
MRAPSFADVVKQHNAEVANWWQGRTHIFLPLGVPQDLPVAIKAEPYLGLNVLLAPPLGSLALQHVR